VREQAPSPYDPIATLYDPWSRSVVEDVPFYVEAAKNAGGPVVELGIGTGRIAVPTAAAGIPVIGVDSSPGMLEVCREAARLAGVEELLDLRLGDLREPPVAERVNLVTSPFRALLHMEDDEQRLQALGAARELLLPGGRLIFDVFRPSREDIEEHLGRAPEFFAYPFGEWDAESAAWARKAGYRAARTYRGGAWNSTSDLYHLRAIPVTDNMQAFERAVSGEVAGVVAQKGR